MSTYLRNRYTVEKEVAIITSMRKLPPVMFCMAMFICLPGVAATESESVSENVAEAALSEAVSESMTRYTIQIGSLTVSDMTLHDTLDVVLDSGGEGIGGFMLKFGFSSPYLQLLEILPGEISDSCHWDLFRSVPINTGDRDDLPEVLWQVTGLAKSSLDTARPGCYGLERSASLFRIVVSSAFLPEVPDTVAPIFFFWEYCRDNVLSDPSGDYMVVSDTVIDLYSADSAARSDDFPTRGGTPQSCINPRRKNAPTRQIEFRNGGVEFKFSIEKTSGNGPDSGDSEQAP